MSISLLCRLVDEESWHNFYLAKTNKYLPQSKTQELKQFIDDKEYLPIARSLISGDYNNFGLPTKKLINKIGKNKKRTIYLFNHDESWVLKHLAYLFYKFDDNFESNCYAFRKQLTSKQAIRKMKAVSDLQPVWGYKTDISNYFNSINVEKLIPILKSMLAEDLKLFDFLTNFLKVDQAIFENQIVIEKRGVMAGMPLAPFLANCYLKEMDSFFAKQELAYVRYSDDILVLNSDKKKVLEAREWIKVYLNNMDLKLNLEKETLIAPKTNWELLGICYQRNEISLTSKIDLSNATKNKIKGKIRRKARALMRWQKRKADVVSLEMTVKILIKKFNIKFFGFDKDNNDDDLTWSRWFFPMLTETVGLKEIDNYLQDYCRFIITGKHSRKNYKQVSYQRLKTLGYLSLVNAYYEWKKMK